MSVELRPTAAVAIYLASLAALAGVIAALGWTPVWQALGLPSMSPAFADLRTVQGALATLAEGGDPRIANPGDPWGRAFNYPPVWLAIARALRLGSETAYLGFVGIYLSLYIAASTWLLHRFPSWVLLLACLSGAVLLGIERGNTDLLIFALVLGAAAWTNPWGRAGLIVLGTVLKLYPLMLAPLILLGRGEHGPRARLMAFAACCAASAALLLPVRDEIRAALAATPTGTGGWLAYGLGTLGGVGQVSTAATVLAVGTLCLHAPRPRLPAGPLATDLLIAGGLIWCASYLLAENYDYRMVFVLPCLPALLRAGRGWAGAAIGVTALLALNQMALLALPGPGFHLNTAAKMALFFLCLVLMLRALMARAERIFPRTASRAAWPGHDLRLPGQGLLERLERG